MLATRLTWEDERSPDELINHPDNESRLVRFNRQLREGHAGRSSARDDE
jgi:hypothetical protein